MSFKLDKPRKLWLEYLDFEVSRFTWDVRYMFDRGNMGKLARSDLSHAYVNLFVEFFRYNAYLFGHLVAFFWWVLPAWWLL
jgi:hypothetical protein